MSTSAVARRILAVLIAAQLSMPMSVCAQVQSVQTTNNSTVTQPLRLTPKVLVDEDIEGVWLPTHQMQLLEDRLEHDEQLNQKLESVVEAEDKVVALQKTQITVTATLAADNAKLAAKQAERANALEQKLQELDSFWRSPVLWLAIGALSTAVVVRLVTPHSGGIL